jgi:hypothetical protein
VLETSDPVDASCHPFEVGWTNYLLPLLVSAVSLVVYVLTIAPSITWRNYGVDSGELASVVHSLGIAHPPGYPLYILVGKLFTFLPFGDVALRLNLMSAAFASSTIALCASCARTLVSRLHPNSHVGFLAVLASSLMLAFSPALWSQSTITEVYTLNAFMFAISCYLLLRCHAAYQQGRDVLAYLCAFALALGLGLANHLTLLALLPGAIVFFLTGQFGRKATNSESATLSHHSSSSILLSLATSFLVGLSAYVYLPIRARADPLFNWGDPDTLARLLKLVTASEYSYLLFGIQGADIVSRLTLLANQVVVQFGWWGAGLALLGLILGYRLHKALLGLTITVSCILFLYAAVYITDDSQLYMIPVYSLMSVWVAVGVAELLVLLSGTWRSIVASVLGSVLVAALIIAPITMNWGKMDLRNDHEPADYALSLESLLPRNSLLITAQDEQLFALWYYGSVGSWRPDVVVVDARLLRWPWYWDQLRRRHPKVANGELPTGVDVVPAIVRAALQDNPVYMTYVDGSLLSAFELEAVGSLVKVTMR